MDRRTFLKLSGLSALSLLGQLNRLSDWLLSLPAVVDFGGIKYRADQQGQISVSQDGGKTWQVHINLGSHCTVERLYAGADGKLYSQVGLQGYRFEIVLAKDGKNWRTVAA